VKLEVTESAARRVAREAARQPRLGARALKEVLRRVVSPLEYDPKAAGGKDGVLRIDIDRVEAALARDVKGGDSSSSVGGWDQSYPAPSSGS
jgi:ATP-dependent protease Clp ATPase subunit